MLRALRNLRAVAVAPRLRRVVEGFITALPRMGSVFLLMSIISYIGGVIATKIFGADFPQRFRSLAQSGYTLFQVMALESWSMGIVLPVLEVYPYAWVFFIQFISVTTLACELACELDSEFDVGRASGGRCTAHGRQQR